VANSVRLLTLNETFLEWIEEGKITAGHGRALLAIEDPKLRLDIAKKASRGKLTVRQVERMATRRAVAGCQAHQAGLMTRIVRLRSMSYRSTLERASPSCYLRRGAQGS